MPRPGTSGRCRTSRPSSSRDCRPSRAGSSRSCSGAFAREACWCWTTRRTPARRVFLSRGGPPPTLARLIANGQLAVLERAAMQLTLDEARGVAAARGVKDAARVAAIHDLTRGWTAGLVLMLERASTDSEQYSADPDSFFD